MTPLAQLMQAVRSGDLETVRSLLVQVDVNGSSALHEAVNAGNTALVRLLLQAGADPLRRDDQGVTCLQLAEQRGWQRVVAALLKAAEIRSLSAPMTLHEAAEHGLLAKVHQLIRAGVDVNEMGAQGSTALQLAARRGHREIVQTLIKAGAHTYAPLDERPLPVPPSQDLLWLGVAVNPQAWKDSFTPLTLSALYDRVGSIAPVLEAGLCEPSIETEAVFKSLASFAALAKDGAFRAAVSLVEECTGIRARMWKKHAGVMIFLESNAADILRQQLREAGYQLISQHANLLLFPAASKFAAIAACGTSGVTYGITARDVVRRLIEFDREAPFHLLGCGSDWIEGQLARRPDGEILEQLLHRLCAMSPDLAADQDERTHAAWQLGRTGRFRLWWD
jgi:hypothetical protein